MPPAQKLPDSLISGYRAWLSTTYVQNRTLHHDLATKGQRPETMIIACCDSRVHVEALFGVNIGEFFVHRNIANLVPPYTPDGQARATSAAVEYGVDVLKVAHLIVMGHSGCGGVRGCHDMCAGEAPQLCEQTSFIGQWLRNLRPGYERVAGIADREARVAALEREAVRIALRNLMTFPFVRGAVEAGTLSLHGLWKDLAEGRLEYLDQETGDFAPV